MRATEKSPGATTNFVTRSHTLVHLEENKVMSEADAKAARLVALYFGCHRKSLSSSAVADVCVRKKSAAPSGIDVLAICPGRSITLARSVENMYHVV